MRNVLGILTASLLVAVGLAAPAYATQAAAKKFTSCDGLLAEYANGVAKSKAAANKATKEGFARPRVSAALYKTNGSRLDRDNDGVMCEQEGSQSVSFKTDFGIVTTQAVRAPKSGECTNVPITLDVRNLAPIGSFGLVVGLVSEFGSYVGYEEVSTSPQVVYPYNITQPGVYYMSLKACGDPHSWTHVSGNRQQAVSGVRPDEQVFLAFSSWLSERRLGLKTYSWL